MLAGLCRYVGLGGTIMIVGLLLLGGLALLVRAVDTFVNMGKYDARRDD